VNILILGGAGFLGNSLVRACLAQGGNHVVVVDSLDPSLRSEKANLADTLESIEFIEGDIRNLPLLRDLVKHQDLVFNCAAQTSHTQSISDPVFDAEINCIGNLNVLEAVRAISPDAVVAYPSTSTVIGKALTDEIDEDHIERPLEIYSAHKGVAEKHYQIYSQVHNLKTVVLRFANLYGPYGKGFPEFGFLNYFIHLANTGQDITVYGEGGQARNVMFVDDAADILLRCATDSRLYGGLYFATHHEHLNVSQIAHKIVDTFQRGQVVTVDWPEERRRIEIDSVRFSSAKLRDITGWEPRYSFDEGLASTKKTLETTAVA
jgi:UDP-glucose 4-epimerase